MVVKIKSFLIGCALILALSSVTVFGQESRGALKDQRITIQMSQKPLYTVFWRLIQKYDVAIGFEESALDRDHRHYYFETNTALEELKKESVSDKEFLPPVTAFKEHLITVDFKDARLEDVMNGIVKQLENYDWEINDEVVNIFPTRGRDERLKKLLDQRIRAFGVGKGASLSSIQAQLMLFLPEFKEFLAENKLEGSTERPFSSFEERILPGGMGFSDMTFRQLLNAITKAKRGGWMLQIKNYSDQPGKEFVEIII